MKVIDLERWEPVQDNPGRVQFAGLRTGQAVFAELKERLENTGLLPDEYFLMDSYWDMGKEIPKGADIFCTTDYGGSEGIYLDVYLKWYEDGKPVTQSFATGKTLADNGTALDRMFLTASAVTKAFHGYGSVRDIQSQDLLLCLNPEERDTFVEALLRHREEGLKNVDQTEKLLRRMTGSITAYMDIVGHRPLRISDFDKAMLAIRDGEMEQFAKLLPNAMDHQGELLIAAAGRTGPVGNKMLVELLCTGEMVDAPTYLTACQKAVETGEVGRVQFLLEQAETSAMDMEPSLYGEVLSNAYPDHRHMAGEIIAHCPQEWISGAEPELLFKAAMAQDYRSCEKLLDMGATTGGYAADIINTMLMRNEGWWVTVLLDHGLEIQPTDYRIMKACLDNHSESIAKLLVDRGMDFDRYLEWEGRNGIAFGDEPTRQSLQSYWSDQQKPPQQKIDLKIGEISL